MRKNPKQQSFFPKESLSFGGSLLKNSHARSPRPISTKECLHIVLKSDKAEKSETQDLRLTKTKSEIEALVKTKTSEHGIRIHELAIASNHIHILISLKNRRKYLSWIRRLTGLIARKMLGAEKGRPGGTSFWTHRPFTRVVFWGRDYWGVKNYIVRNILEAIGFIPYTPRGYKTYSSSS